MSFQLNLPPSMIAKEAKTEEEKDGDEMKKKSREDYKKMKELEEARKAGTVPAMVDEEGKDINPHIPQYIMQAPWYIGSKVPTLKHQRQQDEKQKVFAKMDKWFKKGVKQGPVATKYRKGACENCGALTHKKKDCLERPRKTGAKYTGEDIAPDEYVNEDINFDYEGKRDRWNGYDTDEHSRIFEEYAKLEEAKRVLKSKNLDEALESGKTETLRKDDDDEADEDKYAEHADMPGQKFETKQRITVRNLRIREDIAKYLYNLDPNSAYYDAKTRSMRENPLKGTNKDPTELGLGFSGDNFVRYSGDAHDMANQQLFAWEAYEKGAEVHLQADPTKLELLKKQYAEKKDKFESQKKNSVLEKYGGEEHLESMPRELLMAQTENYVEYSRSGKVIKGQEKAVIRSRYEEDIYNNNHTSVWGSFWHNGRWGYKCCHSLVKESYCTGEAGKEAAQSQLAELTQTADEDREQEEHKSLYQQHQEKLQKDLANRKQKDKKRRKKKKKRRSDSSSSSSSSDSDSDEEKIDEEKLKLALLRQEEQQREAERLMRMDERKRPYNSMIDVREPTKEEMEAYRMKQPKFDDPMAHFLS